MKYTANFKRNCCIFGSLNRRVLSILLCLLLGSTILSIDLTVESADELLGVYDDNLCVTDLVLRTR